MQQDQTKKTTICFHKMPSTLAWNPAGAAVRQEISPVALEPMAAKHQEFKSAASPWVWLEFSFLNGVFLYRKQINLFQTLLPALVSAKRRVLPLSVLAGWGNLVTGWKRHSTLKHRFSPYIYQSKMNKTNHDFYTLYFICIRSFLFGRKIKKHYQWSTVSKSACGL